jgi:hypothetical protein
MEGSSVMVHFNIDAFENFGGFCQELCGLHGLNNVIPWQPFAVPPYLGRKRVGGDRGSLDIDHCIASSLSCRAVR